MHCVGTCELNMALDVRRWLNLRVSAGIVHAVLAQRGWFGVGQNACVEAEL